MRRRAFVTGAAVAVAAAATGGGWWLGRRPAVPATAGVPIATATVVRTDLAIAGQVQGDLRYRGEYPVFAAGGGGTVTALPRPGQVISRGEPVFELNNRPVRLFYADRPVWRPFGTGMSAGPDVRALEENLVALGHADRRGLSVDDRFTTQSATAVRRWQRATGQPVTGRVDLGAITFQPGPLRITALTARLGTISRSEEPVLTGTSTTPVVAIEVPAAQAHLVHAGDAVTVTLPDQSTVPGTITYLSTVANAPEDGGDGRTARPTVAGEVTLDAPAPTGLDRAPVQVNITGRVAHGVLAVPITALVALAGGGYAVYVRTGDDRRLVEVTIGLFANTLVEVGGDGLREGDTVEVPAG